VRGNVVLGIVGIIGTLLGVVLGHLLHQLTLRSAERKKLEDELSYWTESIKLEQTRNYLPVYLHGLRECLLHNQALLGRAENREFFTKWLTGFSVVEGESVNDLSWTPERIAELSRDLDSIRT
jgi:hypothetical protein